MNHPYAVLGVTPEADPVAIKAAYHQKLRQYPAHSHPQEFQQIRTAYEAIRAAAEHRQDPLQPGPLLIDIDQDTLAALETQARAACHLCLDDLLRLTF